MSWIGCDCDRVADGDADNDDDVADKGESVELVADKANAADVAGAESADDGD